MRRKKISIILIILIFLLNNSKIKGEIIKLVDIPTAKTILRGYYNIDFVAYGGGGVQTKVMIGLTDRLTLGVSEDIGRAIGNQTADWNIPGVVAKLNIIYPDIDKIGVAVGYDSLLTGEYGKCYNNQLTDDVVYGLYVTFSKPVHLFTGEQYWHFGARFPLLPFEARKKGKNISLFSGLNIIVNDEIMLIGEIENIYLSGNRSKEILYNAALRYSFNESLSVGVTFQYTSSRDINPTDKASRSIFIEYQNIFY